MPRGDGTGPMGIGSMTGRAAGYCAGFNGPGFTNVVRGRGYISGAGRGRGWRHMYYATGLPGWMRGYPGNAEPYAAPNIEPNIEMEKQFLKGQADNLQRQLGEIKKRLVALENLEAKRAQADEE
ncbi:MAG: DUF5320 domain-containing protein [Desulfobacterales bacterium]|nr:DUF5320 domain-containing protein [Desulfobacterales bacterium]